jgi:hypothetical protein
LRAARFFAGPFAAVFLRPPAARLGAAAPPRSAMILRTVSFSSATCFDRVSTSRPVITPRRLNDFETRSSNTCSSLSHLPPAEALAWRMFFRASSAAPTARAPIVRPCSTSDSNIFGPSVLARSKAPRPASQIFCADRARLGGLVARGFRAAAGTGLACHEGLLFLEREFPV